MNRKGLFIILILLLFVSAACSGKKTGADNAGGKIDLSGYGVTNRITSSIISNKVLDVIDKSIVTWIGNSKIVDAIKASNQANAKRTKTDIDDKDAAWRNNDTALINSYMNNPVSAFLKEIADKSNGLFSEIFIMDFQGCLVGLSHKTSDFLQGDEDKFRISYNQGAGHVFIDSIELDESTQSRLVQISLPIVDPVTGKVIGAVTIGTDINKL